jgi:hypothetical protein
MPLHVKHFLIGFVFVTCVLSQAQNDLDFYIANYRQPAIAQVAREQVMSKLVQMKVVLQRSASLRTDLVIESAEALSHSNAKIGLLPQSVLKPLDDELTAQHYDAVLKRIDACRSI